MLRRAKPEAQLRTPTDRAGDLLRTVIRSACGPAGVGDAAVRSGAGGAAAALIPRWRRRALDLPTSDLPIKRMLIDQPLSRGCPTSCMPAVAKLIREALRRVSRATATSVGRSSRARRWPSATPACRSRRSRRSRRRPGACPTPRRSRASRGRSASSPARSTSTRSPSRGATGRAVNRAREAEALGDRAQQRGERPAGAPDTTPARRGRGDRAT